jgi:S1-C subfamily serine protease
MAAPQAPAQAEPPVQGSGLGEADFQKLLTEKAPAIVTIKFVLKVESSWGQREDEQEASGVMIEPGGFVLTANTELGGATWLRRTGGRAVPTDIKVLIGDEAEGRDAQIIARDSELDLAWVRVNDPGDKQFACVDLNDAASIEIGDRLYFVTRMGKYFDRVPVVREGRVGGQTRKPRKLYVPSGGSGALGLPVFNAAGQVVGVSVSQMPDPEEVGDAGYMGYGGYGLILPAAEVVKATQRAKEIAEQDEEGED